MSTFTAMRRVPRYETSPFAQTHSGRAFPLIDPTYHDIYWPDVAYALAHANRYAGNAGAYSVAQHSILVANVLPEWLRPYGILHDAHEFVIGDMTRPTKMALMALGLDMDPFERLRDGIDRAMYYAAGLAWPVSRETREIIKHADLRVTMTEKRDVLTPMSVTDKEWLHGPEPVEPLTETIVAWADPIHAQRKFEQELKRYGIG